jgi:hypothetical protein
MEVHSLHLYIYIKINNIVTLKKEVQIFQQLGNVEK